MNNSDEFDDFLEKVGNKHNITTIYFIVENSPKDDFSVDIDSDIWHKFINYCFRNNLDVERTLIKAIEEFLNKEKTRILNARNEIDE